ncbi:acetyl-CoA acetyltransferase [Caldisphaera lagunensis DSM 15908]|uniref:Acetyl-CoA acetyltransferase n=1 Tax=Caldisphaera lagunensis (strain DSM 15908 / JCM 11604 / ANMR 0165 / IC-154) TaxID=1056495 RepID=L0AA15_CALLD|nr:thiolase family protein [Caldisphaera lagunensis]AFZ70264.1 acetyl-CoA acetyltransferase [Caldisphaera lagunensis DSM 15908]
MVVYVEGVGMTKIDRHYDYSLKDLAAKAAFNAIDQSGGADGIDYLIFSSSLASLQDSQLDSASYLATSLGLKGVRALNIEAGEASGLAAISVAKSLLESHQADKVLVVGAEKLNEFVSSKVYKQLQMLYDGDTKSFYNIGFAGEAALLMRLYMDTYNINRDTMSYWPALMHSNAKENPYAMLNFAIKPDKVAKSQILADPITLLDSYPLGDGAAAVVLSNRDVARSPIAKISAIESSTGYGSIEMSDDPLQFDSLSDAYRRISNIADLSNIDFIEIHDSFTITAMIILETLGFANRGKAAELVSTGYFSPGGKGPVANPSGGLKARGHPLGATGIYQIAESSLQVSGKFPGIKISNAKKGLVVSLNGLGSSAYVALVEGV